MRYSLLVLAFGTLLTGCATMVTGTETDVSIDSTPANASIEINGQDYGNTPRNVTLTSERSHEITFSMKGYETETIKLHKTTSGWVLGNLLLGGVPGLIIDLASGGIYVLTPKAVDAEMNRTETTALSVRVRMGVQKDLPRIGTLTPTR